MPIDKIVNENPHKDIYLILRIQKVMKILEKGLKLTNQLILDLLL